MWQNLCLLHRPSREKILFQTLFCGKIYTPPYKAQKWTEVKNYPFESKRLIEELINSWNYCQWAHISTYFHLIHYFRIYKYATTHTADSVYIIGGYGDDYTSSIAKYKNDIWTIAGNLKQARGYPGAITVNGLVMIIVGHSYAELT